eukprot:CAMPEP_0172538382 /NCGR_PEP_ID=MMETSP1067-20121228/9762_1 /TAXON_ID=265564 ORGANISM="Thalassiosira punctigera, Strain Tpunct2005C2" /NCGR_SAMPLE_ID=MMETSP1067 /ASSEMBLY_ACC=CAM_ASM_000444 /LENGTH=1434 /DNA_ID=CAMNT_0013323865 /DNA_START=104 /DNA_END=4408 /DNA_ORIENTATION=-
MVNLSKVAFAALLLLGGVGVPSSIGPRAALAQEGDEYDGGDLQRDIVVGDVDDPGDPTEPVESNADVSNTLLVTYSSDSGLSNIINHVEEARGKGKGVMLKGNNRYKSPKRRPGRSGGGLDGGGQPGGGTGGEGGKGGNGKGGSDNPKARSGGNSKGKRNRWLEAGEDEGELDVGFVTLETTDGETTNSELSELGGLEGVTNVEHDVELTVAEVKSLRGANAANEHVREIIEAMGAEQAGLNIEYAPEHEDDHDDRRRLAEDTPYGINHVNVTHLWSIEPQQHVKICVIDTGYDLGHPDLPSDGVTGWDAHSPETQSWDVDGHSHGTHCAGTIGAIGGNDAGVVGVMPNPSKFSFHIGKGLSDSGSGSGAAVIAAVKDCVDKGAKVISMSLGCGNCYVAAYDQAYKDAYDAGVLIVAAAGNSGRDSVHYPSGYKSVISVASVMESKKLSYFSTRNDQTEIAAPGHYVKSTVPRNKESYGTKSGTSMACPHVAGVAALLVSHFPNCNNNQIRNAMIHSASEPPTDSLNLPGWDKYYGWGLVNAGMAYELLKNEGCIGAGGAAPDEAAGEKLSDMALGGKDQKTNGCTTDSQCQNGNLCLGEMKCNTDTNKCYQVEGTAPDCDDGVKCTIDTCDPTKPILNNDPKSMCVHTPKTCEDEDKCNGIYSCDPLTGNCQQDTPPVDCDDGMACTIDKCITDTGQCQYTQKMCNDNNVCTFGDKCDNSTGCVFQPPVEDCCGNAQCDASEDEESCPIDCSDSITTSFDTGVARHRYLGSVFNIATKSKNVTIAGVGVHCILPNDKVGKVHVYTLGGDYYGNGNWYKKYRWTKVLEQDVTCAGAGLSTNVSFPEVVKIGKNKVQAFSIYVLTDNIMTDYPTTRHIPHSAGRHAVYKEDSYVQIRTGSGNFCASGWCAILTPMAYSGSFNYVVVDDSPTTHPTLSMKPTTPPPTNSPTSTPPTDSPTTKPTHSPTSSPTESPSAAPSTSIAPTAFQPEVVEMLTHPAGWANILRAVYFNVTAGDEWARITDLQVVTCRTTSLQVYMKRGNAATYENSPCDWTMVAETEDGWDGRYWKKVYPPWKNGFESVVMEPNETVSFYVANTGSSNGILGKRTGNRGTWYKSSWTKLDSTSAVGAVRMADGRTGYNNEQLFKPHSKYYSAYGMYGGLKMETMQAGSTQAPTTAPTEPFSPDALTSPVAESGEVKDFNGVQFDVDNTGDDFAIITSFDVHFKSTGSKHIEVWSRSGSHKGGSLGSCSPGQNFNNWCNEWKKLAHGNVDAQGLGKFTATPEFSVAVKAKTTVAFAIVSQNGRLSTHSATASSATVQGSHLRINDATCIDDYYGSNLQTSHEVDSTRFKFEGTINYAIGYGKCAYLSHFPWTRLPNGASSMDIDEGDPEEAIMVYEPEEGDPDDEDGPPLDGSPGEGGPSDGEGGPEEGVMYQ